MKTNGADQIAHLCSWFASLLFTIGISWFSSGVGHSLKYITVNVQSNLKLHFLFVCSQQLHNVHLEATSLINSFIAGGNICRLQITFANSLDPYQNVRPDLDSNCLTLKKCSWQNFLKKSFNFEKSQQTTTKACKITQHAKSLLRKSLKTRN